MNYFKTTLLVISVSVTWNLPTFAQDNRYFISYAELLTGRIFLSQKFTSFKYQNSQERYTLNYQPNTKFDIGAGVSYRWATVNLSVGLGFLSPDGDKGKTSHVDLQFHGFGKKYALDILGQFYKGFYLTPKGESTTPDRYYIRPDLRVNIVGGSIQHIFNYRRFSLRAAYWQNAWQKKSAGSFLAGFEAYGGRVKSDSTLTPVGISRNAADRAETKISFFEFGPNAGYAYTLVVRQHFFVTGSALVSLDYGVSSLTSKAGINEAHGFSSNIFSRVIAGYNSARWAFSIMYINNSVQLIDNNDHQEILLNTGNTRVSLVHRFALGSAEKKLLKGI